MLLEGVPAPTIEQASSQAGYPAPVLQLSDELNLKLMRKIRDATKAAGGEGGAVGRPPRRGGHRPACSTSSTGPASSRAPASTSTRTASAPVCGRACATRSRRSQDPSTLSLSDLEERMLFIESLESVRCLDEGVIESVADANIGSILGHRLPGLDRRRAPVHQRLRAGRPGRLRRPRARAGGARTASASSRPRRWSRRPRSGETYSDEAPLLAVS